MKRGFTLIELLVVISIIGVLMGLLLVAFQGSRKTARDGKRQADLEQIRAGLEMCRNDSTTLSYPVNLAACSYVPSVSDPLPGYSYSYTPSPAGGPVYTTYTLCAYIEIGGGVVTGCGSCGTAACNYKVTNP